MSKSFKKNPVGKVKGFQKDDYWSKVRATTKNILRSKDVSELEEVALPSPKSIVNDYDVVDQIYRCDSDCRCVTNYGFKKCISK